MGISLTFARLSPSGGQVGYALLTRAPVDAHQKQAFDVVSPRLACVKPVASVHPEPGSNSTLYNILIHFCHDSEIKASFHFSRCSKSCKISFTTNLLRSRCLFVSVSERASKLKFKVKQTLTVRFSSTQERTLCFVLASCTTSVLCNLFKELFLYSLPPNASHSQFA